MRVLHVTSGIDPVIGGPVTALVGWAEAQVRAGLDVSVASSWSRGQDLSLADHLRRAGVNVELIGPAVRRLGMWHPRTRARLAPLARRADVIHIHALWEDIQHQAARVARGLGVPYVVTPHGMLARWSLAQRATKKRLYMWARLRHHLEAAAALHFTAAAERDEAALLGLGPMALVETLGLDLREFEVLPAPGSFRTRHAAIGDRPVVLFLSRLHPKKGLDLLIPAFARLRAADAMLVLAGPDQDGYAASVSRWVAEHRLHGRTLLTGMLYEGDRIAALVDADVFVLPSYQENFGVVVIEALASGTPVIISDQVNIHAEISAAGVGEVIRPDVTSLTGALDRWLRDDQLRKAAGGRARPFVFAHHDWDRIAERWVGHYRQIVATGSAALTGRAL
jgi:glycosyltransferase involved in cell wall biosynthesis